MPLLIALDTAVDLGGANPIYECRPNHSNDVRPANGSALAELLRPCLPVVHAARSAS
ncbi:hypothetical protein ACLMAL_36095 (plasmid) [Nocardia sp. CWNU-33]|uniref:hypothetical protein n=1 Tax=Nocardia sp. CWNU-33 TaxID=3392117 RepID=UPI00398E3377